MNYSSHDGHVRVDRFRSFSLKWYDTVAIDMEKFYTLYNIPHDAVCAALLFYYGRLSEEFIYVCLEPFHKSAYPVILRGDYEIQSKST